MSGTSQLLQEMIPNAMEPIEDFKQDEHVIYEGSFQLRNKKVVLPATGRVYYLFQDSTHLLLKGTTSDRVIVEWLGVTASISSKRVHGKLLLFEITTPAEGEITFYAKVVAFRNGQDIPYPRWRWAFSNVPAFFGSPVRSGNSTYLARLTFTVDCFRIIFENRKELSFSAHISANGKYLSHYCILEHINGDNIDHDVAEEVILAFTYFISFVVGRRHCPYFIQGSNVDNTQSTSYHKAYIDDCLVGVTSWKPYVLFERDIVDLWQHFYKIYSANNDDSDVLKTAIHWYLEANVNHGMLEGAFVMAFTGVELMYNVIVGEEGQRNEEIINRIKERLHLGNSVSAPAVSNMRNQLVHYASDNRAKYKHISIAEKNKRMGMLLSLLELSILYWLGYRGHYSDRLLESKWRGDDVKLIPWVNEKDKG